MCFHIGLRGERLLPAGIDRRLANLDQLGVAPMTTREILRDLVRRIENADFNPHHNGCERQRRGLALTPPDACSCGLDLVMNEARALTGG